MGPEKIGPLICPGIFLFIDYFCLLYCSLTSVNTPFARRAPSSRLSCPYQAGRCFVGPTVPATWGPTIVRAVRGYPGRPRGGRRHWPAGPFFPERSGAFCMFRGVPGGVRGGANTATWCLPGPFGRPSWSGVTLVNLGASPGVTPDFTTMGGVVNGSGSQPLSVFKSMGWAA
jgi:hypothetical protein